MIKVKLINFSNKRVVTTKYGEREVASYSCNSPDFNGGRDFFASLWLNATTKTWKEGETHDIERIDESSYTKKDGSAGKSYTLIVPKTDSPSKFSEQLDRIEQKIDKLLNNQNPDNEAKY
jgi:hypothetical protein